MERLLQVQLRRCGPPATKAFLLPLLLLLLVVAAVAVGSGRAEPHGGRVRLNRKSGIPDTIAYAGYIFNYTLPDDVFDGDVHHYDVTEAGDIRLPGWLQFDARNRRLVGLPDLADEGKVYICVKAYGFGMRAHRRHGTREEGDTSIAELDDQRSSASLAAGGGSNGDFSTGQYKDVFSIEVLPAKSKDPHCRFEARMTLMVDADLHFLPLESKIEMTCALAACLAVPLDSVRLTAMMSQHNSAVAAAAAAAAAMSVPTAPGISSSGVISELGGGDPSAVEASNSAGANFLYPGQYRGGSLDSADSHHLRSGAGDGLKRTKAGVQFEWPVASDCEGTGGLTADAEDQIRLVETAARDGTLRQLLLHHRVLGWHVRAAGGGLKGSGGAAAVPSSASAASVNGDDDDALGGVGQVSGFSVMRQRRDMGGISHTPMPGIVMPSATIANDFDWDASASPDTRIVPSMSSPEVDPSSRVPHLHPPPHYHQLASTRRPSDDVYITPSVTMYSMLPSYVYSTPVLPPPRPSFTYIAHGLDDFMPTITPVIEPSSTFPPTDVSGGQPTEVSPPVLPDPHIPEPPPPTVNNKPVVNRRLKKLVMTAGAIFTYKIPAETFVDEEDGDTRGLSLELTNMNGHPVGSNSFLQLEKENQTLFALPLSDQTGKYNYLLKAYDNAGESVTETFEVNVWQHPGERNFHHRFKMSVQPRGDWDWSIGWPMDVVHVLSDYFGDGDEVKITITGIIKETHTISWTNSTLPAAPCPRETLKQIEKKLNKESGEPRGVLIKMMNAKEITIVHISLEMLGLCKTPVSTGAPAGDNPPPVRRNNIGELQAIVGRIFQYKIPEDIFYDFNDGTTRYLSLHLRNINGESVTPQSWLQFNAKTQELSGLPEITDIGRMEYLMSAADKLGQEANDVFTVEVKKAEFEKQHSIEFSIQLDESLEEFTKNASKKVLVAWRLARLYYDPDPHKITVTSISNNSNGSVMYSWTNNTLATERCPSEHIQSLSSKLIEQLPRQQANASHISRMLVDAMWPDFRVLKADVRPLAACLGSGGVPPSTGVSPPLAPPIHPGQQPDLDDDVYVTTVIPALVIIFMLVMATAVACCLYSKRRRGSLGMHDNSFYHKGIPIILSEEFEDRPHMVGGGSGGKRPAIMHDERPPLARNEAVAPLLGPSVGQGPAQRRPADGYHHSSATPYAGPPPGISSGGNGGRARGVPSYRNPPPYVPP